MRLVLLLIAALLYTGAAPEQGEPIDRVLGAWQGKVEHDGESRDVIFEFVRSRDRVVMLGSTPAIHAWRFPVAIVTMSGNRITSGSLAIDFDPAADTLTTTIPAELIPKYQMKTTLRRREAVTPEARRGIDAPIRQPAWTASLGAATWADVAWLDGQAIVGAEDGRLHAFDEQGRERWTFKTGGAIRARAAPAGHDVVVQADDGLLYRIDGRTGKARWSVKIGDPVARVALSDPASRYENRAPAVAVDGNRLFTGTHDGRILAIDARSGAKLWEYTTGDTIAATPVVAGGRVFCGSFDGFVYALDASTGTLAWKHDAGGPVTSAVAVSGNRVFSGSRSFDFEALDAQTGAALWRRYFWFSWVESPATVAGTAAFVGSSDAATVSSIDTASGRVNWSADALGSAWGQPAVTDSTVYAAVAGVLHYTAPHKGSLIALDRSTGAVIWWYPARPPDPAPDTVTPYGFAGSVAVGNGKVFAASLDGVLYAFELSGGRAPRDHRNRTAVLRQL